MPHLLNAGLAGTGNPGDPSALMTAGRLVPQLADVLIPLLRCEASGCGANPVDGVLDVQVPEPGGAVVATAGQGMPVGAERHRVHGDGAAGQGLAERLGICGVGDIPQPDRSVRSPLVMVCPSGLSTNDSTSMPPPVRGWPSCRMYAGSVTSHSWIAPP